MNDASSPRAWSRSELVISLLLGAAILALGALWWSEVKALERNALVAPERLDDASSTAADPAALLAMQQKEMAWRPLSQDTINRFLVAARLTGDAAMTERVAGIMEGFAWRTTAGQLNLIALHLEKQEYDRIFDHGDALLRRDAAAEEIYALFSFYEQMPAERQRLVKELEKWPPWRQGYLASAERLLTAGQIEARYATIHKLLTDGRVRRDELASLLSPMVQIGAVNEAYDLWRMAEQPRLNGGNAVYDADFRRAIALQETGGAVRYPFEWQFESGRNSGAQLYDDRGNPRLEIYWDGQGSPVFASQLIKATPGRYRLTMQGFEGSEQARVAIGAELLCPSVAAVSFFPAESGKSDLVVFESDRRALCEFPYLRIVGRPDQAQRDIELSLSGVSVVALN